MGLPGDIERIRGILAERGRVAADPDPRLVDAAVLLPLFELDGQLQMLFTLRTQHVKHHKGQVSFPGGARDPEDTSLEATALRETTEEIGIPAESVDVLGALDDLVTISLYRVTPVVARIPWPAPITGSEQEIAEVFWIPLKTLLDPRNCRLETREHQGLTVYPIYFFEGGAHPVWGVTGHILSHFLEVAFDWRHPELVPDLVTPRSEWLSHLSRQPLT